MSFRGGLSRFAPILTHCSIPCPYVGIPRSLTRVFGAPPARPPCSFSVPNAAVFSSKPITLMDFPCTRRCIVVLNHSYGWLNVRAQCGSFLLVPCPCTSAQRLLCPASLLACSDTLVKFLTFYNLALLNVKMQPSTPLFSNLHPSFKITRALLLNNSYPFILVTRTLLF